MLRALGFGKSQKRAYASKLEASSNIKTTSAQYFLGVFVRCYQVSQLFGTVPCADGLLSVFKPCKPELAFQDSVKLYD